MGVSAYLCESFDNETVFWNLQERGSIFIGPGVSVYGGMIIGEHSRDGDLDVNVLKIKKLSNVRSSGADDAIKLTPPRDLTLEQAIEFLKDDELLEVTPENFRLRKRYLNIHERRKHAPKKAK